MKSLFRVNKVLADFFASSSVGIELVFPVETSNLMYYTSPSVDSSAAFLGVWTEWSSFRSTFESDACSNNLPCGVRTLGM